VNSLWYTKGKQVDDDFGALQGLSATNTRNHGGDVKKETLEIYQKATGIMHQIIIIILAYLIKVYKVKQSRYTPWRRLGGEEV
jgi:hypothetical protein